MPPRGDAAVQYRTGNGAGERTNNDRLVIDCIKTTSTIHEK